jgi:hypothetical protein
MMSGWILHECDVLRRAGEGLVTGFEEHVLQFEIYFIN